MVKVDWVNDGGARDFESPAVVSCRVNFQKPFAMAHENLKMLFFVLLVYTILSLKRVEVRGQGIRRSSREEKICLT